MDVLDRVGGVVNVPGEVFPGRFFEERGGDAEPEGDKLCQASGAVVVRGVLEDHCDFVSGRGEYLVLVQVSVSG